MSYYILGSIRTEGRTVPNVLLKGVSLLIALIQVGPFTTHLFLLFWIDNLDRKQRNTILGSLGQQYSSWRPFNAVATGLMLKPAMATLNGLQQAEYCSVARIKTISYLLYTNIIYSNQYLRYK